MMLTYLAEHPLLFTQKVTMSISLMMISLKQVTVYIHLMASLSEGQLQQGILALQRLNRPHH